MLNQSVTNSLILFIIFRLLPANIDVVGVLRWLPRLLKTLLVLVLCFTRFVAHSILLFFATVVAIASIALHLLSLEVPLLSVASLELFYALLQLGEVELQVFVDFAHLEVLLFEILTALSDLLELLIEPHLRESKRS